jgi:hypothetical protein
VTAVAGPSSAVGATFVEAVAGPFGLFRVDSFEALVVLAELVVVSWLERPGKVAGPLVQDFGHIELVA